VGHGYGNGYSSDVLNSWVNMIQIIIIAKKAKNIISPIGLLHF
jgi:hypothetical protein